MNRSRYLYLLLALTILIWGNSFVVVRIAIDDGSSPILIGMTRLILASSIFGVYLLRRRPALPRRRDLWQFMYLAFVGVGVYYVFQYYGVKLAGPSITSILVTLLSPIMIIVISFLSLRERMSAAQGSGVAVAAIGSFLVITGGDLSFQLDGSALLGGLLGVVCAAFWAVYTVGGKRLLKTYAPLPSTAYLTLMGTLMLTPFAFVDATVNRPVFSLSLLVAALYLGLLCTVVGHFLWFKVLRELTASSTGASLFTEPVVTIFFAWVMLGQGIGWIAAVGGLLVMLGVIMVSRI